MANLACNSNGNFTAAGTWSLLDSTSFQDTEAASTATTTAFVSSQAFTPGAITIDGIGVKVSARSGAPAGTFSVRLAIAGVAVPGTTVTINVSDIASINLANNNGFVFMKFSAPVLLVAATAYTVQVLSSTNGQVTLYRSATAGDWSRYLRTTTTQAPVASDALYVTGEYISAGTNNLLTVTMNNTTSATTFGAIQVSSRGLLNWGVAASTNYYLKILGNLSVYTDGYYQQGTSGTPIPSTSTAKLEFANVSNVQFGIEGRLGGTIKTGGNVITNSALLAADAAASATSLTTNVSTGWKNGDNIALASTTRTKAETENKLLTADASGTTLTISALTNAHSGTSPIAAELINLTRNVQIFGTSSVNQAYINILGTGVTDFQSTEFYNLGSATALKRGIDVGTTTGSITINNCSIHDFIVASSMGINMNSGTGNNYTISNNVVYNIANIGINTTATSGSSYTLNNNIVMLTGSTAINIADLTGTITNLTGISATGAGIILTDLTGTATEIFGTMSGFTAHANTTIGVSLINIVAVTNNPMALVSNITAYRNNTNGLQLSNCFTMILDTITGFGNTTANVSFGASDCGNITLKNMTLNAGTTLTSPIGLNFAGDAYVIFIDSSTFGSTTTHATGDANVAGVAILPQVVFRNCLLSSATPVSNTANMTEGSFISFAKFQQTAGNHKTFKKYGTIVPDITIFNRASPSSRLTPNNADSREKLQGSIKKFAVPSGQSAVVNVFLRKSVVGDGSAYNGNQPRLMLKIDPSIGVTGNVDQVLATADNTYNGTFKLLSATTPVITDNGVFQVYLDCDGTTGWVNEDDWSVNS